MIPRSFNYIQPQLHTKTLNTNGSASTLDSRECANNAQSFSCADLYVCSWNCFANFSAFTCLVFSWAWKTKNFEANSNNRSRHNGLGCHSALKLRCWTARNRINGRSIRSKSNWVLDKRVLKNRIFENVDKWSDSTRNRWILILTPCFWRIWPQNPQNLLVSLKDWEFTGK